MPPGRDVASLLRGMALPEAFSTLLGEDQRQWPPEARFLMAAYYGNVCQMKRIATGLSMEGKEIPVTVGSTKFLGINALHAVSSAVAMLPPFQYLVEEVNMDVRKPDDLGRTPLEHAVTRGHLAPVKYLLDHGADLHQRHSSGNGTLLHTAALNGRSEIAKFLISRGVDVNGEADCGTPLALAAQRGYTSTVKVLLEHNADPNKATEHQFRPLILALNNLSLSCVKLLIQAGADVNGLGPGLGPCDNPLAIAAEKGLTEAIKWMLEAGADPNVPDMFGRMPIELAAEYGTREDVEILFPGTLAIPTVANWSIDGVINQVHLEINKLEDDRFAKMILSDLKRQGDEAFKNHEYLNASLFYTQALKVDRFDTEMLKRRNLCWVHIINEENADDVTTRRKMIFSRWLSAYFMQRAALTFLKPESKPPFVFSRPPAVGNSEISVINICTKEVSTVSDPGYKDASCYHSADGWLFMLTGISGIHAKAFLIKPCTGQRIDLPDIPTRFVGPSVFSTVDGVPDVVVCFDRNSRYPSMLIKSSDAQQWKVFEYPTKVECGSIKYGTIIASDIYYVDDMGKIMVFNILESNWRLVCAVGWGRGKVRGGRQFFVTAEGNIIRIHCPPPCYEVFYFSKFDRQQGKWIPLTEDELENKSWFLSYGMSGQRSFVSRWENGKKVYLLSPNDEKRGPNGPSRVLRPLPAVQQANIYVHDLDTSTSEPLLSEPFPSVTHFWISGACF
ncbi:unnamed protein product [Alopecurus aequalis]